MTTATFRPKFTIEQVKALYKVLVNYNLKSEDMQEAIIIERLKKTIKQFLVLHDTDAIEQVDNKLKEDAFADYDWAAAFASIPPGGIPPVK